MLLYMLYFIYWNVVTSGVIMEKRWNTGAGNLLTFLKNLHKCSHRENLLGGVIEAYIYLRNNFLIMLLYCFEPTITCDLCVVV